VDRLQGICDRMGPEQIDALLRKWLKILPNPFTAEDQAAGPPGVGLATERIWLFCEVAARSGGDT